MTPKLKSQKGRPREEPARRLPRTVAEEIDALRQLCAELERDLAAAEAEIARRPIPDAVDLT